MAPCGYTWLLFLCLCCTGLDAAPPGLQTWVEQLHEELAHVETELDTYINTNSSDSERLQQLQILLKPLKDDISELDHEAIKYAVVDHLDTSQHTDNPQLDRIERMLATHFKDYTPDHNSTDDRRPMVHTDCKAAYEAGWVTSGVYRIKPNGRTEMNVFCEQEKYGGGWAVIQRRVDGSEDFYRHWEDYKDGFGDLYGEHWLGNDNIHQLTLNSDQKLKVELQDGGTFGYADYSSFEIGDEDNKYKLRVSGFSDTNTVGDALTYHNGMFYTTRDRDNDEWDSGNLAVTYRSAWWYPSGYYTNLNGIYNVRIRWDTWSDHLVTLSGVRMLLKTK